MIEIMRHWFIYIYIKREKYSEQKKNLTSIQQMTVKSSQK